MTAWLLASLGVTLIAAVAATFVRSPFRVMRQRVSVALLAFVGALAALAILAARGEVVRVPAVDGGGAAIVEVTGSRMPFLLTLALATSALAIAAPAGSISARSMRRTMVGFVGTAMLFASTHIVVLGLASLVVILSVHADLLERSTTRTAVGEARLAGLILGIAALGSLALVAGALLAPSSEAWVFDSFSGGAGSLLPKTMLVALVVTNLVRLAPFPFQAWLPITLDRASVGPASIALLSQPAAILVLHEAFPRLLGAASLESRTVLVSASAVMLMVSGAFSAVVALVQHDVRRAIGYVVSSQNALAIAGIVTGTLEGSVAAVLCALGGAFTGVGLLLVTHGIESRAGRVDALDSLGLARFWPRLGAAFLLLALTMIGFPGSLQFFAEDLLLQGLLEAHPFAAYSVLAIAALNGITMLRLFFGQFFGPGARLTGDEYVPPDMGYAELVGPVGLLGVMAALVLLAPTVSVIFER